MRRIILLHSLIVFLSVIALAQDQSKKRYTRADFINIDGGTLSERVDRAFKQFKGAKQSDSLWIAYHFPAREGMSIGPFSGMVYYDEGIRLERREDISTAAIFLLTDGSGQTPLIKKVKTLNLSEPFIFEDRPVYWLGNADSGESIALMENVMRANKENKDTVRSALRAIAVHNSPRAVSLLKDVAVKDTDMDVRRSAIANLSRVKTPESLDALIELYDKSTEDAIKEEIINGIGRDESRKSADKLLTIAKNDPDPKMRQRAIRRLSTNKGTFVWSN